MSALLDGVPVGPISAGALVALAVLLVLTGRLVPRGSLLDVMADRDKAYTDRDHYREAFEELRGAVLQQGMTLERLVETVEATHSVMVSIQTGLHGSENPR